MPRIVLALAAWKPSITALTINAIVIIGAILANPAANLAPPFLIIDLAADSTTSSIDPAAALRPSFFTSILNTLEMVDLSLDSNSADSFATLETIGAFFDKEENRLEAVLVADDPTLPATEATF